MDNEKPKDRPEVFDSHAHLYSPAVIANVASLDGLAAAIGLDIEGAGCRTDKVALKRECGAAGIQACLLLPTAPVNRVHQVNDLSIKTVEGDKSLFTAGTLHPASSGMDEELEWLKSRGIRALKLCSFSQAFDLESEETQLLFDKIRAHNIAGKPRFFVVLDTFYQADAYFHAPKNHLTTPRKLGRLVEDFPEIDFVGAHMGGLAAPFGELVECLPPKSNLYLDTSNAAQLLSRDEFIRLLHRHGPDHILFGTDWPWFSFKEEVTRIQGLVHEAGFSAQEESKIFSENICRLLGAFEIKTHSKNATDFTDLNL